MQAHADSLAFTPPREPATFRAFVFAVIAHLLLMAALTWGINWKKDADTTIAVEAELWASVPQQAAPRAAITPPVITPPVITQPVITPPVITPPVTVPPVVAPPAVVPPVIEKVVPPRPVIQQPDINIERDKKRREIEKQRKLELEEKKKLDAALKKKEQQEDAARERREEAARQKREEAARDKRADQAKLAKLEKAEKQKQEAEAAKLKADRQKNIDRMLASAAGTGSPNSSGTARVSKGPSASYAGRIAGKVKPNITFTDVISGNPAAVIHLRIAPDGTIVGSKLVKSSGVKSWDDAVMRAIDKTQTIPRDTDGSVVPEFDIELKPRD